MDKWDKKTGRPKNNKTEKRAKQLKKFMSKGAPGRSFRQMEERRKKYLETY